jgi:ArsR family transcriptional regulator, arsenate/arsenite/antimonite-responsive transcriptional repressor
MLNGRTFTERGKMKRAVRDEVRILKALASEPRLEIMRLLREHPHCVNALAERLKMTQPAISQHLQLLREVGLVRAEKRGTWIHYTIDPETMEEHGRAMAEIFGGWVALPEPMDGKSGCPATLLQECQAKRPVKKAGKGRVS